MSEQRINIPRQQLAQIVGDNPQALRAFEQIFSQVGQLKDADTEGTPPVPPVPAVVTNALARIDELEAMIASINLPSLAPLSIPNNALVRARDAALLAAYARNGGVRMVNLGDSIQAGIGSTGSSPYGECADMINQAAGNLFAYSLMYADPNFVAPRADVFPVQPTFTSAGGAGTFNPLGSFPLPNWQMTKTKSDTIAFTIRQEFSIVHSEVTLYHLERNSTAAATYRVRVYDDVTLLATATVDTYTANPTFPGVGAVTVQGRIGKYTITLPTTARILRVVIDTPDTVSRAGAAVATDGTAVIFGATAGQGVFFRNLAVSSTTLLESSPDNVLRGITTSERLAKAAALNANVYLIGWGTNDSKVGISTPAAYKAGLIKLIKTLRATVVRPVIILAAAPAGLAAPYLNNVVYNNAMREVAVECSVSLIDYEDIAAASPAYSDDVHPTRQGYDQMHASLCASFVVPNHRLTIGKLGLDTTSFPKYVYQAIAGGTSNFTGVATTLTTQTVNRVGNFNMRTRLKLVFAATVAFNASLIRIKIQGYAGLNGTGATVGALTTVDESVFSAPLVGTTAILPYFTQVTRVFSQTETRSVVITVEGINWGLRNTNATHYLETEFISPD